MYQDTFRIFYDPFGGDRFGIVWDPSLKQPRPFRVLGGFSFCVTSSAEAKASLSPSLYSYCRVLIHATRVKKVKIRIQWY